MPKRFYAVMVKCPHCEREAWVGYLILHSEAAWFNTLNKRFRDACAYCDAEILSDVYLKGVDSLSEILPGQRRLPSVPSSGEPG